MKPIVRNIQNSELYFYEGENSFKNIRTGKTGVVDDETARKVFRVNVEATTIINEYPVIENLIKALHLRFDNNKT